jgi:hypothetical protein
VRICRLEAGCDNSHICPKQGDTTLGLKAVTPDGSSREARPLWSRPVSCPGQRCRRRPATGAIQPDLETPDNVQFDVNQGVDLLAKQRFDTEDSERKKDPDDSQDEADNGQDNTEPASSYTSRIHECLATMISDRDIWAAALLMVKRYGDDAMLEASERADQLLDEGDMAGAET